MTYVTDLGFISVKGGGLKNGLLEIMNSGMMWAYRVIGSWWGD